VHLQRPALARDLPGHGIAGVEIVALGYNTPIENIHTREPEHLRLFHHLLSLQAGAYQNAAWCWLRPNAAPRTGSR